MSVVHRKRWGETNIYVAAIRAGLCGICKKAPATHGVFCEPCRDKNTARNRRKPRKTGRRWSAVRS